MRLTEMQKKEIIAEYASGESSKNALALKYGVSHATIRKVIDGDSSFREKVTGIKNAAEKSLAKSIKERLEQKAEGLLEVANLSIQRLKETVPNASPRDAAGALKISMDALFQMVDRAKGEVERGSQENALDAFVTAMKAAAEAHKND